MSSTTPMFVPPELFHNFTMDLVNELRRRGQSDSSATIIVGVGVGIFLSSMIVSVAMFCRKSVMLLGSNRWNREGCEAKQSAGTTATRACDAASMQDGEDGEGIGEQYTDPSLRNVELHVPTEGGYRSHSESSDEGEGVAVTKAAQKRSRHKNGL